MRPNSIIINAQMNTLWSTSTFFATCTDRAHFSKFPPNLLKSTAIWLHLDMLSQHNWLYLCWPKWHRLEIVDLPSGCSTHKSFLRHNKANTPAQIDRHLLWMHDTSPPSEPISYRQQLNCMNNSVSGWELQQHHQDASWGHPLDTTPQQVRIPK